MDKRKNSSDTGSGIEKKQVILTKEMLQKRNKVYWLLEEVKMVVELSVGLSDNSYVFKAIIRREY